MKPSLKYKFGSSSSLEGIIHLLIQFYCGNTSITLEDKGDHWEVYRGSGGDGTPFTRKICSGVVVVKSGKRYVFGSIA